MARARATQGTVGQFTYDFGVQIAKGTVREITRLTGVSLTLASAFYTLKNTAQEYLDVVTKNNLRMGGIVQAMREYETANKRLVKGLTFSSPRQQIEGMNELMAAGIDVEKNFEWISKSAHAMGKSFDEFAGAISNGIHGNMGALVDMGLMTQRSTRAFQKYTADTIQRQQAILSFVKEHKGLQAAVKDDFIRIQDEIKRIKGAWNGFIRSIVGDPKNPNSFYGQIRSAVKEVADAVARNYESIKQFGQGIGMVLGWVARQIGHVIMWLGKEVKRVSKSLIGTVDNFGEAMMSFVVWLEFWKVRFVKVFNAVYGFLVKHEKLIFRILKLYVALKAINWVWGIGSSAIASVVRYAGAINMAAKAQRAYYIYQLKSGIPAIRAWIQSLGAFLPRRLRHLWTAVGRGVADIVEMGFFKWLKYILGKAGKSLGFFFAHVIGFAKRAFNVIRTLFTASNPVGWIVLAITLIVVLYKKCEGFRKLVNALIYGLLESLKMLWNLLMAAYVRIRVGISKVWDWMNEWIFQPIGEAFRELGNLIKLVWGTIKDSAVGRFIKDYIVDPIAWVIDKIVGAWGKIKDFFKGFGRLWGVNDRISENTQAYAAEHGISVKTFGTSKANFGTNWLNTDNWGGGSQTPALPQVQPLPVATSNPAPTSFMGNPGNTTTIQSGAVQIIIQNGENIDENVLAERVRTVLVDLQREGNLRGGR